MEALILIIVVGYLVKKGAESGHLHWQSSKSANRSSTSGQKAGRRAASAVQHDAGYWAHQVLNGFPQTRQGVAAGWHAGRTAQAQGAADRQKARAEHLALRARLAPEIRDHLRRQDEALEQIRAARQPDPAPAPVDDGGPAWDGRGIAAPQEPSRPATTGGPVTGVDVNNPRPGDRIDRDYGPRSKRNGGTGMAASGDTTYTQQLREFTAIRDDAEEEVNSIRLKRMLNHLDILQTLGLDKDSLAEAAAIDDALRQQQKAAQETLDAADAASQGLKTRHGGIQEAVSDSPVDQPAQPEFYAD